jgi:aminoglycoside phosphotransferase family enzyme/predicted kinase
MTKRNDVEMTDEEDRGSQPFVALAETHTAAVFLVGDRAYKMKKPVDFGFLDFRSPEARAAACRREVELNRRLSPDTYLGVGELRGPEGGVVEHLVVMRRMPADRSLRTLAEHGADLDLEVCSIADRLAAFHARAERSEAISRGGTAAVVATRWRANDGRMRALAPRVFDPEVLSSLLAGAERYIAGRHPLFARRVAAGRIRDGHGDLLTDDIFCLRDGPRILDCLEFDDQLRWCDVVADVASLAMDLEHRGRPELATALLSRYRGAAGDDWPASLAHHYIAYRAQVRALVAGLRSAQGDATAADEALRLIKESRRHLDAGRVRLVLVGGLPGSGKSTLAAEVAAALGAAVVRSDEVRKMQAGLDPGSSAPAGVGRDLYRPEVTEATYRQLLSEVRRLLADGHSVVADATFADPRWRSAARRLASAAFADLDELRCVAPPAVLEDRVTRRAAAGGDASDATVAVLRAFAAREAPWNEAAAIDTGGAPEDARAKAFEILGVGASSSNQG